GLLLARAVQVGGADLAAAEQLEPLGEDLLQLRDGAPLEEHVPVGPRRLLGLHLGLDALGAARLGAALGALPQGGHVGLESHGGLDLVPVGTGVAGLLAGGELDAWLVLEALAAQSGAP